MPKIIDDTFIEWVVDELTERENIQNTKKYGFKNTLKNVCANHSFSDKDCNRVLESAKKKAQEEGTTFTKVMFNNFQ